MHIDTKLKEKVNIIESQQKEILSKLSNIEEKLNKNTEIIVDYFATYAEKKKHKFIETVKKGNFTMKQLSAIQELANILTEVLDDKEKLEEGRNF